MYGYIDTAGCRCEILLGSRTQDIYVNTSAAFKILSRY